MSAALIALLVSAGVSVWIFTKLQNHTGSGNNQSAIVGALGIFIVLFIVMFTVTHSILQG